VGHHRQPSITSTRDPDRQCCRLMFWRRKDTELSDATSVNGRDAARYNHVVASFAWCIGPTHKTYLKKEEKSCDREGEVVDHDERLGSQHHDDVSSASMHILRHVWICCHANADDDDDTIVHSFVDTDIEHVVVARGRQ
jgi:hypothetical protein